MDVENLTPAQRAFIADMADAGIPLVELMDDGLAMATLARLGREDREKAKLLEERK